MFSVQCVQCAVCSECSESVKFAVCSVMCVQCALLVPGTRRNSPVCSNTGPRKHSGPSIL